MKRPAAVVDFAGLLKGAGGADAILTGDRLYPVFFIIFVLG